MTFRKTQISTAQLVCLMLVCSIPLVVTSNTSFLGGDHMIDNLLSCGIAFLCNFFLFLPIYFLMRRRSDCNLLLQAGQVGRWLLYCAAIATILYFLVLNLQFLATLELFLSNAFDTAVPTWIFPAMIVLSSIYASYHGLDAIGRTAILICSMVLLGFLLIGTLLLPEVQSTNFTPVLYEGPNQMLAGTLFFLTANGSLVTFLILFPTASGKPTLGFLFWNVITFALASFLLFIIVGVLGDFANLQLFPLYSAATMASLGTFQRLDTVFISMWLVGMFIKLAINFYVISLCCNEIFGRRTAIVVKPACGLFLFIGSILISNNRSWMNVVFNPLFTLPFTAAAVLVIPLVTLIGNAVKDRRMKRHA